MNFMEELIFEWIGKVIGLIGFGGIIFTVLFDKVARGLWQGWGWIQWSGFLVFFLVFLAGFYIDTLLGKAKKLIDEGLER